MVVMGKQFPRKYSGQSQNVALSLVTLKVAVCEQAKLFNSYWEHGDKNIQDNIIANSLLAQVPKKIVPIQQRKYKPRVTIWKYRVMISGFEYGCCRKFFLDVLQVIPKTVRGIQNKINKGEQ